VSIQARGKLFVACGKLARGFPLVVLSRSEGLISAKATTADVCMIKSMQ